MGRVEPVTEEIRFPSPEREFRGIEFWRYGEWTMVYEDGRLVRAGDHYLADEWLQGKFGVKVVEDTAGLSIPDTVHARESLAEVYAAWDARENRLAEAERLRAQALELNNRARELENER